MKSWKVLLCSMLVFLLTAWAAPASAEEIVIGFTGPLSGPAAEYGQDCLYGVDMAINEINAAGGVAVQGKKYTYRLAKLDDGVDPTRAKNNALRFVSQDKAPVVFVPIATTIGAVMGVPQTPGSEFLIAAYTSLHVFMDKGHPMIITPVPNFALYADNMASYARQKGYKRCAMLVTAGAYGDAWRKVFSINWVNKGGQIVGDFPANYYGETDFSSQIAAALSKKPDVMLIGGPSATTALVIEQARNMGFKGGFVMIDQAKPDYIARVLKNMNMLEGMISTASVTDLPLPIIPSFSKNYTAKYKRAPTWECGLNYTMMHVINRAVKAGNSVKAVDIRRNIAKALPTAGDKFPNELFDIEENGVMHCGNAMQTVANGKFSKVDYVLSFPKTKLAFDKYKKMSKSLDPDMIRWSPVQ